MKPLEFWVSNLGGKYVVDFDKPDYIKEAKTYHVREVIEISEQEIRNLAFDYDIANEHKDIEKAFEAGARWAISKMRGGE